MANGHKKLTERFFVRLALVFRFPFLVFSSFQSKSWATLKWACAVEEEAVRCVHLVFGSADVALNHSVHYGVEVANPRKLKRAIVALPRFDVCFEDMGHNGALDALALELRRNAENDTEGSVARLADLQIPQKSQLLDDAELAVELADYAV